MTKLTQMVNTSLKNGDVAENTTKLKAQKRKGYSDNFLNRSVHEKIIGNNILHKLITMKNKSNFNQ